MMKKASVFELSPYIREVGMQGQDEWPNRARRIYDYQFFFCFKGRGIFTLDGQTYSLCPGTLFVVPPNRPHTYSLDRENPCDCYWFHCDLFARDDREWVYRYYNCPEDYLQLFRPRLLHEEHIREQVEWTEGPWLPAWIRVEEPEEYRHHFERMYQAFLSGSPMWQLCAASSFFALVFTLFQEAEKEGRGSVKLRHQVNLMKSYIRRNYFRKIKAEEIAGVTAYSVDYASRIFKQLTGRSLHDWLTQYRLGKAKRFLTDLDLSIADVAEMCGFTNESYFSAVVRAKEGRSPSQLRDSLMRMVRDDQGESCVERDT